MLEFACDKRELSCIIGNLFTEINPPCASCAATDELTISGKMHDGERGILIVTEYGFRFSGDPRIIQRIREKRCVIEQSRTGGG